MNEEVMVVIVAIFLVPACILCTSVCIMGFLDIYTDIQDKITQMRRKNYCRRCGKVIPKKDTYCRECYAQEWYGG